MAVVGMGQFHRFWQLLPWPVALAAAACVVARLLGRWSIAAAVVLVGAAARAPRRTGILARAGELGCRRRHRGDAVVALIREPRRDIDRGPWWAASR